MLKRAVEGECGTVGGASRFWTANIPRSICPVAIVLLLNPTHCAVSICTAYAWFLMVAGLTLVLEEPRQKLKYK